MSEVGVNGMHNISEPEWTPISELLKAEYMRALDDVQTRVHYQIGDNVMPWEIDKIINQLKQSYQEQNDGN